MGAMEFRRLRDEELQEFKREMMKAFQKGAEDVFGPIEQTILPEADIDKSLSTEGSAAYVAVTDGEIVGGAVVVINTETRRNSLDFLFARAGNQSRGVGRFIWESIERTYPETKVWETCTPYFEKRNIHFYINVCGFHAVEFFDDRHKDPREEGEHGIGVGDECMFGFEKVM